MAMPSCIISSVARQQQPGSLAAWLGERTVRLLPKWDKMHHEPLMTDCQPLPRVSSHTYARLCLRWSTLTIVLALTPRKAWNEKNRVLQDVGEH